MPMRNFKQKEFQTFEKLVALSQTEVHQSMYSLLKNKYKKVVQTKDYIYAEGDIPIALVSHMDTVHLQSASTVFYDRQKNVVWSPQGLGADDRAGIFAIISILKTNLRPHIILTHDEEIGGKGACALASLPCPFKNLKYMIELDRRGSNDCVFYDVDNPLFTEYIEAFGFTENWGSYSDICDLSSAWKVVSVNLSVGYHNEHTLGEYLHVSALLQTISKVKTMLSCQEIPTFEYMESYFSNYKYPYSSYTGYLDKNNEYQKYYNNDWYAYDDMAYVHCDQCKALFAEHEVIPIKKKLGGTKFLCPDCFSLQNIHWCCICNEAFEAIEGEETYGMCPDCYDKYEKVSIEND